MNSKISLFNRSIVKSDCKRFWWVSALEGLLVLMLTLAMINGLEYAPARSCTDSLYDSFLMQYMFPVIFIQFFVPAALVVLLMSYLNKGNSVSFMHSLPLGRKKLFASHMLSAMLLILAPIVLTCLAATVVMLLPDGMNAIGAAQILTLGAEAAVYAIFVAAATAFVCTLSGNMIFSFVITYAIAALPALAEVLLRYLIANTLYGYPDRSCSVSFFLWLYKNPAYASAPYFVGLFAAAVIFILLANIILKKRALENYGEMIAFPRLKPIFTCAAAVFGGAVGYVYFTVITGKYNLLYLIPFGILGIVIANMLNKKQLTLRGTPRTAAIYTLCILLFFGFFKLDLAGYEKHIPKSDEIASARVYLNYYSLRDHTYIIDGKRYTFTEKDPFIPDITGDDIEKVRTLHGYAVKSRPDGGNDLRIEYTLKNGKSVMRRYDIDLFAPGADEAVAPVAELNAVKAQKLPLLDGTEKTFTSMTVQFGSASQPTTVIKDEALMRELADALISDLGNLSYESYLKHPTTTPLRIIAEYQKELVCSTEVPKSLESEKIQSETEYYTIRPEYVNTLAILEKYRLIPELPAASEIRDIELSFGDMSDDAATESASSYDTVTVTDPVQIEEIYGFIRQNTLNASINSGSIRDYCEINVQFRDSAKDFHVAYDVSLLPQSILSLR